jgi:hypothetical protein
VLFSCWIHLHACITVNVRVVLVLLTHVFTNAKRCAYVQAMCPMNVFDIEDLGDAGRKGAGKGSKSSKPSALAGEVSNPVQCSCVVRADRTARVGYPSTYCGLRGVVLLSQS